MPNRLRIKNWKGFQHYTDRCPPWIKLHFSILSSKDWVCGTDPDRLLAVICMLVASRDAEGDGSFDADPSFFRRIAYLDYLPDFKPLIKSGFLEMLAGASEPEQMQADATTEQSRVDQSKEEKSRAPEEPAQARTILESANKSKTIPIVPDGFALFWTLYPRKLAKNAAAKAWRRQIGENARTQEQVLAGLEAWKLSKQWLDEDYVPYPATFLNQRRWEEIPAIGGGKRATDIEHSINESAELARKYGVSESHHQLADTSGRALQPEGAIAAGGKGSIHQGTPKPPSGGLR